MRLGLAIELLLHLASGVLVILFCDLSCVLQSLRQLVGRIFSVEFPVQVLLEECWLSCLDPICQEMWRVLYRAVKRRVVRKHQRRDV